MAEGNELRTGAATKSGQQVVLGTVFMSLAKTVVLSRVAGAAKVAEIEESLPEGVSIEAVRYDRTSLSLDRTIATVRHQPDQGALLVIAVLFVLLALSPGGVITARGHLHLSMLIDRYLERCAVACPGTLTSLRALNFGLIVEWRRDHRGEHAAPASASRGALGRTPGSRGQRSSLRRGPGR